MPREVGIDDNGYYFYYDNGANLTVEFDDFGQPYDANTHQQVDLIYDDGVNPAIYLTDKALAALIAIYGKREDIPPNRVAIRTTASGVVPMVNVSSQSGGGGGLFGGKVTVPTEYIILGVLFLITFSFGKSRK